MRTVNFGGKTRTVMYNDELTEILLKRKDQLPYSMYKELVMEIKEDIKNGIIIIEN